MEKLPQRLAFDRYALLCPLAGIAGGARNGLLDLFRRFRRLRRIVDAHVHGTVTLAAQSRHQAGAQYRGLAQSRLSKQNGQQLALHSSSELGDFLFAAVEILPRLFRERRQSQPGIAFIDGALRLRVHDCRARMKSATRCANSRGTTPPGNWVKCRALNLSGTSASAELVASMHTGRINSAPSAILRTRSSA